MDRARPHAGASSPRQGCLRAGRAFVWPLPRQGGLLSASAGATRSIGRGLAKDGQVAQDGDGLNSPFAESLLKHLYEPGLEINMLFRRVHDDVKARTSGQQEPFTYG